jgi:two-component system, OmpR family, sensor histidine kinase KdpD
MILVISVVVLLLYTCKGIMKFANIKISPFIYNLCRFLLVSGLMMLVSIGFDALRDQLETTLIALLYLIPVGLVTAYWGFGPGITSALISFITFNYFFMLPHYALAAHYPEDIIIMAIYLIVVVVISQLVGRMQSSLLAANAREQEATQLYELSVALTGMHDEHAIAQILAKQAETVLQAEYVELKVAGTEPFSFHFPEDSSPTRPADLILPIQTARNFLGEILLWKATPAISAVEKRLLQTFTSQAALALERAQLTQAEAQAQVLRESDRLKSILLSSVSHELRTPLFTIKAASSSLRGADVVWDSRERVELIEAIDDEADHLNILVGNLLDMSRIESGSLKPKREWNILSEIVGSVAARMRHSMNDHTLDVNVADTLPLIPVDYVQMEQVFTNLVSNGLKYAPANTVIRICANIEGDMFHVQVSNQGTQVPPEHLERIFDKFYRASATERVTGIGLGLSICKGIIEAHGGNIWAENVSDGLAFNFTLPSTWDGIFPPQLQMDTEIE